MSTESRNPRSFGLDKMSAREIVRLMDEEEHQVLRAVRHAADTIALVAERVSSIISAGGRIFYVGAGTSGRIALMDAAEMPPTFGTPADMFVAITAGGADAVAVAVETAEDDEHAAIVALNQHRVNRKDGVIGLTAGGRTPFVLAAIRHARQKGAWTCGIANNKGAPLLALADVSILLDTGPEILTGSTRLKAGTAQKLVLNRISTAAMVLQGKVIRNLMVDVHPGNSKLKERSVRIVRELTMLTEEEARAWLERHNWQIRSVIAEAESQGKAT